MKKDTSMRLSALTVCFRFFIIQKSVSHDIKDTKFYRYAKSDKKLSYDNRRQMPLGHHILNLHSYLNKKKTLKSDTQYIRSQF